MTSTNQEIYLAEGLFVCKILGLWISFLLTRVAWDWLARFAEDKPIVRDFFVPSDDRGLVRSFCSYVWQEIPRRMWLLRLAFSSLHGRLFLLLQAVVIYQLGMHGYLNDLSPVIRQEIPADWIFYLGDPAPGNIAVMFLAGAFLTFLFVRPLLVPTVALALVFNGVLSLAGALAMLVAERLAIRLMFFFSFRTKVKPLDLLPLVVIAVLTSWFAMFAGRDFFLGWSHFLGATEFKPWDRFLLLGFAIFLVSLVETAISCAFYHFYFIRTADEKVQEAFPPRQYLWAGWASSDLKAAIIGRAVARFEALEKMDTELENGQMKAQLPGALLARLQKERRELRKLLKA